MAIIEVNSYKLPLNEKKYLNLKSLLPRLQKEFPISEYSLELLKINGDKIIEEDDPRLVRPIEREDHISVNFFRNKTIYQVMIQDLFELIDKIIFKVKAVSEQLSESDEVDIASMSLIIEALDLFINSVNHTSSEVLKKDLELKESLPIKELQIHLLSIVKALRAAYMKEDYIMLTDLLEYELSDNLTQWKILILPILKQKEASAYSYQKSTEI